MKGFTTNQNIIDKDFEKTFNRYYVTKQYPEAFLLCINNIGIPLLKEVAYNNAKKVIPKLKSTIEVTENINMDFIIDTLMSNGYEPTMKNESLSLFPCIKIRIEKQQIIMKRPISYWILLSLILIIFPFYILLPITLPLFIISTCKRRKIKKCICDALIAYYQNK